MSTPSKSNPLIKAVLFDLDGTLVDTAPDIASALNAVIRRHGGEALPLTRVRQHLSNGGEALLGLAFGDSLTASERQALVEELFDEYQQHLGRASCFFPGIEQTLALLKENNLPWGIVTNKLQRHTLPLLKHLGLYHPKLCIACRDTLNKPKPDPAHLFHVCEQLKIAPEDCLFIGDDKTDIMAGQRAGTHTALAAYGYCRDQADYTTWGADHLLHQSLDLLPLCATFTHPVRPL